MAVTLDTLKKSIGKKKAKTMAFAWLADYENMAGDVDNALARVDAGLQMYPGDIPGMLVRSKILFQKGRFKECVKECEKVLEKEPFCLSAQKRMGEAYEQMENLDERNRCFRRVHDMDPLDMFWKEEYETVSDTGAAVAGAVAGAAGEALADADFSMPDFADMGAPQAQDSAAVEAPSETAETPAEEDSPFSKSLDMNLDAPAEDFGSMSASPFSTSHGGDESVGRYPDGGKRTYLMTRPTIATTNTLTSYSEWLYGIDENFDEEAFLDAITDIAEDNIQRSVENGSMTYSIDGIRLNHPRRGINIIRTVSPEGKVIIKRQLIR